MKRTALALTAACLALAGCGGGDDVEAASSTTPSPSTSSSSVVPSRTTSAAPATTQAVQTRSPEEEAQFVATVTASTFTQNGDVLSTQLVKSNPLIEAQTQFEFDQAARTVVLVVTSVFKTGNPAVPYGLATDLAPVFWGPQATAAVRPESLVQFSVTVDDSPYLCHGPTMAALADHELSQEMFTAQCSV